MIGFVKWFRSKVDGSWELALGIGKVVIDDTDESSFVKQGQGPQYGFDFNCPSTPHMLKAQFPTGWQVAEVQEVRPSERKLEVFGSVLLEQVFHLFLCTSWPSQRTVVVYRTVIFCLASSLRTVGPTDHRLRFRIHLPKRLLSLYKLFTLCIFFPQ